MCWQVAVTQALLVQQPQGAGAQAPGPGHQGAAPVDLSAVSVATVDSFQARCLWLPVPPALQASMLGR